MRLLQILACQLAAFAFASPADKVYVDSPTRTIRDAQGRHLVMHGVNVVYKVAPYMPPADKYDSQDSLTDNDILALKNWGFNFVRLGVMWEAVERAPGVYNETYLSEVDKLITKLGDQGIYTMVDAHQDVLARIVCGEGMPNFYAKQVIKGKSGPDGAPYCFNKWLDPILLPVVKKRGECLSIEQDYDHRKDADGNPVIEDCQKTPFWHYFNTREALALYESLYTNDFGMQDKFVAYWDKVSATLSKNKYVIGYDPINEPLPSNYIRNPLLTRPGVFDREQLTPLYKRIFEKYEKNNVKVNGKEAKNIMFFEPGQFPDEQGVGPTGIVNRLGFRTPPGGELGSDAHVLNDHSYCCQLADDMCKTGEPDVNKGPECAAWHYKRIHTRELDAQALKIPLFISEFGACLDSEVCGREIKQVAEACDQFVAGWAYWEFKPFHDITTSAGTHSEGFYNKDGTLQIYKITELTRPYVRAAQGLIKSMKAGDDYNSFNASVLIDSQVEAPTEVYINTEYWFKSECKAVQLNAVRADGKAMAEGTDYTLDTERLGDAKNVLFKFKAKKSLDKVQVDFTVTKGACDEQKLIQ